MKELHSLLRRQLKRHCGILDEPDIPESMKDFVSAVNDAYYHSDDDRKMLEHSLETSSKELSEMNREMSAILKVFPDMILIISFDGTIHRIVSVQYSGFNFLKESDVGRKIQEFLKPEKESFVRYFEGDLKNVLQSNQIQNIEFKLIEQSNYYFEARFVSYMEDEAYVVIRDISHRKKVEKELMETLEDLKRFKKVTVDREVRMIELKKEINKLHKDLKRTMPFDLEDIERREK